VEYESKEEMIIERVKVEVDQSKAAVDDNTDEGLFQADRNAQEIIQGAKLEAERIKASAERDAARIIAEAKTNAQKKIETIVREAEGKAKHRGQELLQDTIEDIRYHVPPEVESKIIQYASEIVSEAERTAQNIIGEARRRAAAITEPVSAEYSEIASSQTQQEPYAPHLLHELRTRFHEVTFGEPQMYQQKSIRGEGIYLDVHDFPVLAGSDSEPIGTYSVDMFFGEIVAKRYQHNGKLLVVRGRITESEYQSLQQFVDTGKIHEISAQLQKVGTRNYVVYDFPALIWNARYGREDRYSNDVNFP
jgi:vacuolar-type H+-ATPase subunit H